MYASQYVRCREPALPCEPCPGPLVVSFLMPTCASCDALPDVLCGSDPFPDPAGGYNPCSNQRMRCPAQETCNTPQHPTQNTRAVYLWRSLNLILTYCAVPTPSRAPTPLPVQQLTKSPSLVATAPSGAACQCSVRLLANRCSLYAHVAAATRSTDCAPNLCTCICDAICSTMWDTRCSLHLHWRVCIYV
jgi:hypothetical protein